MSTTSLHVFVCEKNEINMPKRFIFWHERFSCNIFKHTQYVNLVYGSFLDPEPAYKHHFSYWHFCKNNAFIRMEKWKRRDQLNNLNNPLLLIRLKNLEASSLVHFVYAYLIFVCIIQYVASIFTFSWLFSVFLQLLFSRLHFLSFEYYSSSSLINTCGVTHAFNKLGIKKSVHSAQKTLFIIMLNSFDSSSFHCA